MLRSPFASVWAALLGSVMLGASSATADILTVALDGSGDYTAIQDAVDASASGDTILVSPGYYLERFSMSGKDVELRSVAGRDKTFFTSDGTNGAILTCDGGESAECVIQGFTIFGADGPGILIDSASPVFKDCRISQNYNSSSEGGGVRLQGSGGSPRFEGCDFVGNRGVGRRGGGLAAVGSAGVLTLVNCSVASNETTGSFGGGIYSQGVAVVIRETDVLSNVARSGDNVRGGGVYVEGAGIEVSDCRFIGNIAYADSGYDRYCYGGALVAETGPTVIERSAFDSNQAYAYERPSYGAYSYGGALDLRGSNPHSIVDCSFSSNEAYATCSHGREMRGGAISIRGNAEPVIERCVFDDNGAVSCNNSAAGYGGTIWWEGGTAGTVVDCEISGSRADYQGGALFADDNAQPFVLRTTIRGAMTFSGGGTGGAVHVDPNANVYFNRCRFSECESANGGAIYSANAQPFVDRCIFDGNVSGAGSSINAVGSGIANVPTIQFTSFCGSPAHIMGDWNDSNPGSNVFLEDCDDCNENGASDAYEIAMGEAEDCDLDGVIDACELALEPDLDCDDDGVLDSCQAAGGNDCDGDGVLDDCEADCDGDGAPDDCQILAGSGSDCDNDGVLDACQIAADPSIDCNANGLPDTCDPDCDGEGTPDDCQVDADPSIDCDGDGVPDLCQLAASDANNDGILDDCQSLDFTGIQVEIAPITGVVRGDGSLMPLSAVCYRIYATFDDPGAHLIGLYGSPKTGSMIFTTDGGLYQDPEGGDLAADRPCDPTGLFPELAFDSLLTVGGDCASGSFEQNVGIDFSGFNTTGSMVETDGIVLLNPEDVQGAPDADGRVLVAQLTTLDGSMPDGRFNLIGTNADGSDFQAFQVTWGDPMLVDCNDNGVQDAFDIGNGSSLDCNLDGIPDECQTEDPYRDCNGNGTPDWCDISTGVSVDVNNNGIPDECECEGDLNGDGLVNVDDIIIVILNWGEFGENLGDANNDGQVDGQDLGLVITAFGGCFG